MRLRFLAAAALTLAALPAFGQTAPCTHATTACQEWITYAGGPARSLIYTTYRLDQPNTKVTRALIMVHGAGRNPDHYFETATSSGFLANALDNTIIIAPRFTTGKDTTSANEVVWPEGRDSWRSGGMSPTNPTLSSFDFVDNLVRQLADKKLFPNLTKIVVAGHSAGGQFANRYETANRVDGTIGNVQLSYVVANPSSYAWPAAVRPLPAGDANPLDAYKASLEPHAEDVHSNYTYGAFDVSKVPNYDKWPAGLENRTGYTAGMSDDELKKNLVERPTTYLLGQVDVLPLGGFDSSPSAMAQGPTRRARGEAFFKYVTETMGARHKAIIVPECGHNDRCIYTTNLVFPVVFP